MLRSQICLHNPPQIKGVGIPRHGEAHMIDECFLPSLWCFHIYSYHAHLELDGAPHELHPGYASVIPPGTRMVYHYEGPSDHVYWHFRPSVGEQTVGIPMVIDLGERYLEMDERARRAAAEISVRTPLARATLWALLCEVAEMASGEKLLARPSRPPIVELALRHIEQRISGQISVALLCEELGVSYGYLGRLFKSCLGRTVLEHVRYRRAEQAHHLIVSTTLPLKVIARAVGVPNLQQFNRLMHEMKGISPRALRRVSFDD